MSGKTMKLTLNIWRQKNAKSEGRVASNLAKDVGPHK